MLRPHHFVLFASLLVDGGTSGHQTPPVVTDAGSGSSSPSHSGLDGGVVVRKPMVVDGIRWPDEVQTLATLDGRAVIAAHAAMQHLLARLVTETKEYAQHCEYSPKAMDVIVGEGGGMYIVRINRRVDRCGWADPSFNAAIDWVELYAVSLDGKVLARYPYSL